MLLWGRVDKITSSLDPSPIVSSDDTWGRANEGGPTFGEAMKAAGDEDGEEAMEVEEEEAAEGEHDYVATPMEGIEEGEGEEEGGGEEGGQALVTMPTGRLMIAFGWSQAGLEDEDDGEDEGIAGEAEAEQEEEEEWMRALCCVRLRGRLIEVKSVHDKISVGQLLWHGMLHRESRGRWGIEECRVLYQCDCRNCERKRG